MYRQNGPVYGLKRLLAWMSHHPSARLIAIGAALLAATVASRLFAVRLATIYAATPAAWNWYVYNAFMILSSVAMLAGIFIGLPFVVVGCLRVLREQSRRRQGTTLVNSICTSSGPAGKSS